MKLAVKTIETKNIVTKSNLPVCDFSVNPYIGCEHACKYCYASFMKRFTNHPEEWGYFLDVKDWGKIKNPEKYSGKELFIGSVTDAYQPAEEKYKRTHALLEQLQGSGAKLSIATKSDLILRDLDLIKTFPDTEVSFSINTLDENFKDDMDCAASIARRINAMKEFYKAGIRTTCFISPIFPKITDVKAIIKETKSFCNLVWLENLNLRGNYRPIILNYIAEKYPELVPLYNAIYSKNDRTYWFELDDEIRAFCKKEGLLYVRDDDSVKRPFNEPPIVVNYFFHEEIKKSAKKNKATEAE